MRKPSLKPSNISREELQERRVSDVERMLRRMLVRNVSSGSDQMATVVNQVAHGFAIGTPVRHNGTDWVKSQADTPSNATVCGMVIAVLSPDVFVMATGGYVSGLTGLSLTPGSLHMVSATVAGTLDTTDQTIYAPVILADTATSGVLLISKSKLYGAVRTPNGGTSYGIIANTTQASPAYRTTCYWKVLGAGGGGGEKHNYANEFYAALTSGASPTQAISIDVAGGGGGAGAIISGVSTGIPASTNFVCVVGTGGASGTSSAVAGSNGGDSSVQFLSQTYIAGGGRGGDGGQLGGRGGLGGNADLYDAYHGADTLILNVQHGHHGQSGGVCTYRTNNKAEGGRGGRNYTTATYRDGQGGDGSGFTGSKTAGFRGAVYLNFVAE